METILNQFGTQSGFLITEPSAIASVRRAGQTLGAQLGFNEQQNGELALLITEAATNIIKHAGEGEILLRSLYWSNTAGIEIIALDRGPGIDDVCLQMLDGNSTAGTYGIGLGTIARLSHEFDVYSQPGEGTILWMRLWSDPKIVRQQTWDIGSVCLPMPGEAVCGDAWTVEISDANLTLMMADGLGHGPDAAQASLKAVEVVQERAHESPALLMQSIHDGLRGTRGAAVAVVQIDRNAEQVNFCGIGNIAVSTFDDQSRRHLVSHNGIAGTNIRKIQEFPQSWFSNMSLIAHSDGINTRWDLDRHPHLRHCHPALIASLLYRDYCRGRDDVSVVVLREASGY